MKLERIYKLGTIKIYNSDKKGQNVATSNLKFDIASWRIQPQLLWEGNDTKQNTIEHLDYVGKKMEIHFNLGSVQLPDTGEMLAVHGKIPMTIPYGLMPEQDLTLGSLTECQDMCNLLAEKLGIFSKKSKYFRKLQHVGIPVISAVTVPGIKLEDMSSYAVLMLTFFILDDIFDNFKDFWTEGLSTSEISTVVDTFCSIISGEMTQSCIRDKPSFPKFMPICNLLLFLRKEVLALGVPLNESKYFFDSFMKYLESCAWETQGWTNKEDNRVNKKFYFYHREMTIGLIPALELICLLKNINLSQKIRRDPLFETLNRQICRHVLVLNDIFSLKKEIANGEKINIILIRNKTKSADHSYAKTLLDLTDCVKNIENIQEQLVKKFPDDVNVEDYFSIGKIWMDAHVQWMFLNQRFGENDFEVGLFI